MNRFWKIVLFMYQYTLAAIGLMPASCGDPKCGCGDLSKWIPPRRLAIHVPLRSGKRQFQEAVEGVVTGRLVSGQGIRL